MIGGGPATRMIAAVLLSGDVQEFLRLRNVPALLKKHELHAWEAVSEHVRRHGVLPSVATARKLGIDLPASVEEPATYYRDQLVDRRIRVGLSQAVQDVNEHLREQPRAALERFRRAVHDLHLVENPAEVLDLRDAVDRVPVSYLQRRRTAEHHVGVQVGWPTVDSLSGGVPPGEVVSFVGRPAMGKTQMLLWAALHAHQVQGRRVAFFSMEMKPHQIEERAAGVVTRTALSEILQQRGRALLEVDLARLRSGLAELREGDVPFWIVDGELSVTVEDVHLMCRHLRPEAVYVDGAYLLQHPNERLQDHQRIRENCRLLKAMANSLGASLFCTWQFNREASRNRTRQQPGMEHIAGSAAIEEISALILALLEGDDDPLSMLHRTLRVLKGRQGEAGQLKIRWDWNGMDFSEVLPEEDEATGFGFGLDAQDSASPDRSVGEPTIEGGDDAAEDDREGRAEARRRPGRRPAAGRGAGGQLRSRAGGRGGPAGEDQ